jgi:hypothetical protein
MAAASFCDAATISDLSQLPSTDSFCSARQLHIFFYYHSDTNDSHKTLSGPSPKQPSTQKARYLVFG